MADVETPVVLRGVTKKFRTTTAVESLNWAPKRGQVTALVGLNGAGKSTAMRVMTGLVKPTEGAVGVSTHQLRELEGTADALTLIHAGRIRYDGPFSDFVGAPSLRVRALDEAATRSLAEVIEAEGVRVEHTVGGLRIGADGADGSSGSPGSPGASGSFGATGVAGVADLLAALIFDVAARNGIKLVELGHEASTLEEAFHAATTGEYL